MTDAGQNAAEKPKPLIVQRLVLRAIYVMQMLDALAGGILARAV
ncbi:MAG: hypothetical protein ACE5HO_07515 [bacterium]